MRHVREPAHRIGKLAGPVNASAVEIDPRASFSMPTRIAERQKDDSLGEQLPRHTNVTRIPIHHTLEVAALLCKISDGSHEAERPQRAVLAAHITHHAIDRTRVGQATPRQSPVEQQSRQRCEHMRTHPHSGELVKSWKRIQRSASHVDTTT